MKAETRHCPKCPDWAPIKTGSPCPGIERGAEFRIAAEMMEDLAANHPNEVVAAEARYLATRLKEMVDAG